MAADKKRASNVKLAWYFSMKVAICCNRCDGAFGRRGVKRRCNTPGTDTTESRQLPHCRMRPGQRDWACITCSSTTTLVPTTSCASFAIFMHICGALSSWCATDCRPTAQPCVDWKTRERGTGCPWNGCRHTRQIWIRSKTFGINPNASTWATLFRMMSTTFTANCKMSSKPIVTNPIDCIRSSRLRDFVNS
jgi:hypothetical protein